MSLAVMLLNILLTILVIVCVALTGVILLQRSEGGALGMGSGPQGMFTARGAGDLLTRTTSILAAAFFILALSITLLAGHNRATSSVTDRLKVGPADLKALTTPAASSAPASSSNPAIPPLPTAIPPLPGTASPSMPTQAPRPTLHPAQPKAQVANGALANIAVRPSTRIMVPRTSLGAPEPASSQPAAPNNP